VFNSAFCHVHTHVPERETGASVYKRPAATLYASPNKMKWVVVECASSAEHLYKIWTHPRRIQSIDSLSTNNTYMTIYNSLSVQWYHRHFLRHNNSSRSLWYEMKHAKRCRSMSDNRKLYYFGFDAEEESIDLVLTHHMHVWRQIRTQKTRRIESADLWLLLFRSSWTAFGLL
jgi:hypothetical protein